MFPYFQKIRKKIVYMKKYITARIFDLHLQNRAKSFVSIKKAYFVENLLMTMSISFAPSATAILISCKMILRFKVVEVNFKREVNAH